MITNFIGWNSNDFILAKDQITAARQRLGVDTEGERRSMTDGEAMAVCKELRRRGEDKAAEYLKTMYYIEEEV